jgi:site-specific DNA recombinase
MLEEHPHPNPSKAREGKHKHRLIIDPIRAPVVPMIFEDYCVRLLGLGEICDKLNRSPGLYPPPIPNRKDESALPHTWSRSVLNALLRNPKYTGFNVWGRNDKRPGRPQIRPREEWVWSPTPTHPPIITRELFDMVEERAQRNASAAKAGRSRAAHRRPKPQARRLYPLRGRVRCGMCGHRMEGSHQKGSNWYRCQYVYRRGAAAAALAGHPKVHGIKEDKILGPILDFLARRVFGPDRLRLLRDELAQVTASTWQEHGSEVERLESELQKINRSLRAQTLRLEEHEDPHHPQSSRSPPNASLSSAPTRPLSRTSSTGPRRSAPQGITPTKSWRCSTPCQTYAPPSRPPPRPNSRISSAPSISRSPTTRTARFSTSPRRSHPSCCPTSPPTKATAPRDGRRLTT